MTGGAYPPEIATRGDHSAYGKNRGYVAEGEWLVGRVVCKIETERRCMGRSASFRIAQRRDFFFSLAPALPVVVGLQGPWFPVQRLSRLLDSYSRCICSDTFLSHESLRRQCTRTASVSGRVLADPPVALTFATRKTLWCVVQV